MSRQRELYAEGGSVRTKVHYLGGARGRQLPQVLAKEEVDALMRVPNLRAPTGLRNRCILALMHRSGLRVSEACGLHLRDIHWSESRIHVRRAVAKGGREAVVYFDQPTGALLERWVDVRRKYAARKPHLFTTLKGGPVSRFYCWQMMQRYARRAGIERSVHPHMLRHTYATELLSEGFNLREVQALLRHSDISVTGIYLHVLDSDLQAKIRARGAPTRESH
jgi:site-specific recombinase XerD